MIRVIILFHFLLVTLISSGQVRQSLHTGYVGFWTDEGSLDFTYVTKKGLSLPSIEQSISGDTYWWLDAIVPKFSLGYARSSGRSMVEVLYLAKELRSFQGIKGPTYRRLDLNYGYLLTSSRSKPEVYATTGVSYIMHRMAEASTGRQTDRGYTINLGFVANYQITKSIYLTASVNASQATHLSFRTIRHLVGFGYRW